MTRKPAIIEFNSDLSTLSKSEKKVISLLTEAAKLVDKIYEQQENPDFLGANFYPHDVTKEELEKTAKTNPEILDPYTVVERKEGQLVTTPYHEKYQDLLKPIADKLLEAAIATEDKNFKVCLELQAKALLDGSYVEATIAWMKPSKPYVIDFLIGPIERYDDKLFFVKTAYQCWVGIIEKKDTEDADRYKQIILNTRRKALTYSEKVDYFDKIQVRVDNLVIFSGLIARTLFVGVNLPNDPNLIEKYGSEVTIFKQVNQKRLQDEILPTFNKVFSPEFKKLFSAQDLEEGSLYSTALHELAHAYLRYKDSEKRLGDLFPIIDELAATVLGIKVCGSLILKDIMSEKQLESIMIAYMSNRLYLVLKEKDNKSIAHYTSGGALFINFLIDSGAVKVANGISWPNFMKMFVSLDELASILERILSQGTREDAQKFIERYGDLENVRKFVESSRS